MNFKTRKVSTLALAGGVLLAVVIGCSSPTPTPTTAAPTSVPPTAVPAVADTAVPPTAAAPTNAAATTAPTTAAVDPTATTAATTGGKITLVVVPEKSEARYRVREQLAGVSLPSDAVGKTNAITGQIVGNPDGSIVSAESKFVVDIRTLKSDQFPRDGFIQRTPLDSSNFPNVTFVPTSATALPLTPPASGAATFKLVGDLTIKDVTKPTTWDASCTLDANQTTGTCTATTSFTFTDFNLEQPRVGRVLSIEDTIKLEVDLTLQLQQ